jgi:hypothetical protein
VIVTIDGARVRISETRAGSGRWRSSVAGGIWSSADAAISASYRALGVEEPS